MFTIFGIFVIIYVISPYDLIPDFFGIFGYLDDLASVFLYLYGIISMFYRGFNQVNEIEYENIRAR